MKRKIITIDEEKCTGCGQCIPDCPEGALQLIEGKARLVSDLFCDGLGACIGTCPAGAISVIEREAAPYDEKAVMETIIRQGSPVIKAHLEHLAGHGQTALYAEALESLRLHSLPVPDHRASGPIPKNEPCAGDVLTGPLTTGPGETGVGAQRSRHFSGCPGMAERVINRPPHSPGAGERPESALRQWPVQMALVNPASPAFENADLLVAADCVPFAFAGFHEEFLRDRVPVVFCPKLDADMRGYISKLAQILSLHKVSSILVVHMEVPCCSGLRYVVDQAQMQAGKEVPVTEVTISLEGEVL